LEASIRQMPSYEATISAMGKAGFTNFNRENYAVKPDLKDLFLQSGKDNPELYFLPEVRSGISTFAALANRNEVEAGLKTLRADIARGTFDHIRMQYDSEA